MALFFSNRPLSATQRRLNWTVLLLLSLLGIALGSWVAKDCAAIASGYAADYEYAIAFGLTVALCVVGLPPLIYWRTRWTSCGVRQRSRGHVRKNQNR